MFEGARLGSGVMHWLPGINILVAKPCERGKGGMLVCKCRFNIFPKAKLAFLARRWFGSSNLYCVLGQGGGGEGWI